MTKKKKRKQRGAGVKKTMEVDLKWLEENPEVATEATPAASARRNTIDVDPSWLEETPEVDIEMPPRDSEVPRRIVPPALPPLELMARPRAKVPAIPREEVDSEPPPPRRTSRRPPAQSAPPAAARRTSKSPPTSSAPSQAPRRTSKRPPPT